MLNVFDLMNAGLENERVIVAQIFKLVYTGLKFRRVQITDLYPRRIFKILYEGILDNSI